MSFRSAWKRILPDLQSLCGAKKLMMEDSEYGYSGDEYEFSGSEKEEYIHDFGFDGPF